MPDQKFAPERSVSQRCTEQVTEILLNILKVNCNLLLTVCAKAKLIYSVSMKSYQYRNFDISENV